MKVVRLHLYQNVYSKSGEQNYVFFNWCIFLNFIFLCMDSLQDIGHKVIKE